MIELRGQALSRLRVIFEQPHGVLFQVREIEHAGLGLAFAVQAVETAQDIEQHLPLCCVMLGDQGIAKVLDLVLEALEH